jgi:DNA repair protein RecO
MSHHIYNTKCFIIDSSSIGESDKIINIYTEEFGLIRSIAQGVREMKSKLRYSLQEATYGTVALVRGRETWRVTNAAKDISLFNRGLSQGSRRALTSLLQFVARFAPGEGKNLEIFEILKNTSSIIFRNQSAEKNEKILTDVLEVLGLIARLRIMYNLGYIKTENLDLEIITDAISIEKLKKWQPQRDKFIQILNDSIIQSHL